MINPQITFGPITIHLYGLIIGIAVYLGWLLTKRRAHLYKIPAKFFDSFLVIIPLGLMLLGARIYHIADYWDIYRQNLLSTLYITNGGLGIFGGLAGFFLGLYLFCRIKKINFLSLLDLLAPSVLLAQAIGRFGNFINQEGFGPPTSMPWGVFINVENRPEQYTNFQKFHPTFFYEAILDGIFFVILIYSARRLKIKGQVFALYLILYSIGRFAVEFLRIDTATIGSFKLAHVLSLSMLISGLILILRPMVSKK